MARYICMIGLLFFPTATRMVYAPGDMVESYGSYNPSVPHIRPTVFRGQGIQVYHYYDDSDNYLGYSLSLPKGASNSTDSYDCERYFTFYDPSRNSVGRAIPDSANSWTLRGIGDSPKTGKVYTRDGYLECTSDIYGVIGYASGGGSTGYNVDNERALEIMLAQELMAKNFGYGFSECLQRVRDFKAQQEAKKSAQLHREHQRHQAVWQAEEEEKRQRQRQRQERERLRRLAEKSRKEQQQKESEKRGEEREKKLEKAYVKYSHPPTTQEQKRKGCLDLFDAMFPNGFPRQVARSFSKESFFLRIADELGIGGIDGMLTEWWSGGYEDYVKDIFADIPPALYTFITGEQLEKLPDHPSIFSWSWISSTKNQQAWNYVQYRHHRQKEGMVRALLEPFLDWAYCHPERVSEAYNMRNQPRDVRNVALSKLGFSGYNPFAVLFHYFKADKIQEYKAHLRAKRKNGCSVM